MAQISIMKPDTLQRCYLVEQAMQHVPNKGVQWKPKVRQRVKPSPESSVTWV